MGLTPAEQAMYDELRAKAEPDEAPAEALAVTALVEVVELEQQFTELAAVVEAEQDAELIEQVAEAAAEHAADEIAADVLPAAATIAADVAEQVAAEVVADLVEAVAELIEEEESEPDPFTAPELPVIEDESPAERHWLYKTRKHPFSRND